MLFTGVIGLSMLNTYSTPASLAASEHIGRRCVSILRLEHCFFIRSFYRLARGAPVLQVPFFNDYYDLASES